MLYISSSEKKKQINIYVDSPISYATVSLNSLSIELIV